MGLDLQVIATSVETEDAPPGQVVLQDPEPGNPLSEGRIIYLTIAEAAGWTPAEREEAAAILAEGIKKEHPLQDRLAAGRCAVLKFERHYEEFADWQHSVFGELSFEGTQDELLRDLGILGKCEDQSGI